MMPSGNPNLRSSPLLLAEVAISTSVSERLGIAERRAPVVTTWANRLTSLIACAVDADLKLRMIADVPDTATALTLFVTV
jgi:hypothetical protein